MTVNCEKCGIKLRIDDAKIPATGVMARCTKCSHRFFLKKEPETGVSALDNTVVSGAGSASANALPEQAKSPEIFDSTRNTAPTPQQRESVTQDRVWPEKREDVSSQAAATAYAPVDKPPISDSDWDFSSFAESRNGATVAGGSVKVAPASDRQAAVGQSGQKDIYEIPNEAQRFAKVVGSQEPDQNETSSAAVAEKKAVNNIDERISTDAAQSRNLTFDQRAYTPVSQPVHEIVADDRRVPMPYGLQQSNLEIFRLLDESGLDEEYVVKMVKEVCEATRYVEGVEKPDWQTRMLGLDMLCKIKGLYPQEKKDDQGNRQLKIVTGINI